MKERIPDRQTPEVMLDLMLQITLQLINHGIEKEEAVIIGKEVVRFVARHWSGSLVYFSHKRLETTLLQEALETFEGDRMSLARLARSHGITTGHAYELLKQIRARVEKADQKEETTDE